MLLLKSFPTKANNFYPFTAEIRWLLISLLRLELRDLLLMPEEFFLNVLLGLTDLEE